MKRDPRIENFSTAISNIAGEAAEAGIEPLAVAVEAALGVRKFMTGRISGDQCAALFREQAAAIDRPDRSRLAPDDRELLELADRGSQFIRTLQLAGVEEGSAITALHNACVLAVARTRGAAGAAGWLRRIADATEANAAAVDQAARAS